MIYELRINCFFEDESDVNDIIDKLDDHKPHMVVLNPGQEDQECSVIDTLVCNHELIPRERCVLTSHWDNCPLV